MKTPFESLVFKPHPCIDSLEIARLQNCSVLRGANDLLGAPYEIMDSNGDIHHFETQEQINDFFLDWR